MLDSISWRIPQKVLYSQFSGTLSLQDFTQMVEATYDMMDKEGRVTGVHSMLDVSRCEHYGRDMMNLQALRAFTRVHPKTRWIVVIDPAPHPVARFVGLSVVKLLRLSYSIVKTEPEAMVFIEHIERSTLQL